MKLDKDARNVHWIQAASLVSGLGNLDITYEVRNKEIDPHLSLLTVYERQLKTGGRVQRKKLQDG